MSQDAPTQSSRGMLGGSIRKGAAIGSIPVMAVLGWAGTQLWDAFLDVAKENREALVRIEARVVAAESEIKTIKDQLDRQSKESWYSLSRHRSQLNKLEVQVGVVRELTEVSLIGEAVRREESDVDSPVSIDAVNDPEAIRKLFSRFDEIENPDPDEYRDEVRMQQQAAPSAKGF